MSRVEERSVSICRKKKGVFLFAEPSVLTVFYYLHPICLNNNNNYWIYIASSIRSKLCCLLLLTRQEIITIISRFAAGQEHGPSALRLQHSPQPTGPTLINEAI